MEPSNGTLVRSWGLGLGRPFLELSMPSLSGVLRATRSRRLGRSSVKKSSQDLFKRPHRLLQLRTLDQKRCACGPEKKRVVFHVVCGRASSKDVLGANLVLLEGAGFVFGIVSV